MSFRDGFTPQVSDSSDAHCRALLSRPCHLKGQYFGPEIRRSQEMNQTRTTSILQRFAVVLAVTAASYGLQAQAQQPRTSGSNGQHQHQQSQASGQQR